MARRPQHVVQRIVGAVALSALVLSASGFSPRHNAPQTRPSTMPHVVPHVLNFTSFNSSDWPDTFDPANVADGPAIQIISMLYANLIKLDSRNHVTPDLASSWTVSPTGRVYTFHLRHNARFSDGKPITARDVTYSLARTLSPTALNGKAPSPVGLSYLGHIVGAADYTAGKTKTVRGITALDAHTVQITIDQPIAFFLQTLSYWSADVVEQGTPIGGLTTTDPLRHQVSSGPFKITAFRYRASLTLAPNPGYYNYKALKLRQINVGFVADENTMYQGYESGQYTMTQVPTSRLLAARRQPDFHSSPALAIDYIVYNVAKPPFNNKAVRLATSYAINRALINNQVLHGSQTTIYSVVPQGIPGYDAAGKGVVPGYDPTRARAYLALAHKQLGKNFPASLTIDYLAGNAGLNQEYTELQYEWKQIGLDVRVQQVPLNTWLSLVTKPTTSLTYTGGGSWVQAQWGDDYPDAEDFTTVLLGPSAISNAGNYDNPQFEALISKALTARGSERAHLYVQAGRIALNDAAWAMIGQQVVSFRWSPRIKGLAVWTSNDNAPRPFNNDWTNVDVQ